MCLGMGVVQKFIFAFGSEVSPCAVGRGESLLEASPTKDPNQILNLSGNYSLRFYSESPS